MKSLMRNSAFDEALLREVYGQPALVPAIPWVGGGRPAKPKLTTVADATGSSVSLSWMPAAGANSWLWLVQTRIGKDWTTEILPVNRSTRKCDGAEVIAVSAVDRNGNASPAAVLSVNRR